MKISYKQLERILLVFAVFIGVAFRLWFISLAPQVFAYDQGEYQLYAQKMLNHPLLLASHSYRNYPFPLFLAVLYLLFGWANHQSIYIANAILDSLSAVLVYVLLKKVTNKRIIHWLGLGMYLVNPFTSGYVGLGLSEVMSSFFIIATIFSGVWVLEKPNIMRGLLFGFLAGMAAETRNAAFIWAGVPLGLTLLFVSVKKYWRVYAAIGFGVFLTVLYPLYVNWRDYKEINISTVDNMFAREFFNGAILKRLPPFTYNYPPEVQYMYVEYYSEFYPQRTTKERKEMAEKYWQKGWAIVKDDPLDYIRVRLDKMWYVWQKENIFFYSEPGFENHKSITYMVNFVLLLFTAVGLIFWKKEEKKSETGRKISTFVRLCILGSILYGTLAFSITHAEYRLTIPFYPLLITSTAIGVSVVVRKLKSARRVK